MYRGRDRADEGITCPTLPPVWATTRQGTPGLVQTRSHNATPIEHSGSHKRRHRHCSQGRPMLQRPDDRAHTGDRTSREGNEMYKTQWTRNSQGGDMSSHPHAETVPAGSKKKRRTAKKHTPKNSPQDKKNIKATMMGPIDITKDTQQACNPMVQLVLQCGYPRQCSPSVPRPHMRRAAPRGLARRPHSKMSS